MALGLIRQGAVAPGYNTFTEPEFVTMMAHMEKFWADEAIPLKDRVRSMGHAIASLCPFLQVTRLTIALADRALTRLPEAERKTITAYLKEIADTGSTIFKNVKEEGRGGTIVRRTPSASSFLVISGTASAPAGSWPPVIATVELWSSLNVTIVPSVTKAANVRCKI